MASILLGFSVNEGGFYVLASTWKILEYLINMKYEQYQYESSYMPIYYWSLIDWNILKLQLDLQSKCWLEYDLVFMLQNDCHLNL